MAVKRDRLTWMVYSQIAIYGFSLYSFGPAVTLLGDDEHVSRAIAALHGTGLAVGTVVAGLLAPRLIRRFGRVRMMWVALTTLSAGVLVMISCNIVPITIFGAVLSGIGGTLIGNLAVALLTSHHGGAVGRASVTESTGVGASVGTLAPLCVGGSIAIGLGWRAAMLGTVAITIAVAIVFGRSVPRDQPSAHAEPVHHTTGRLPLEYWRACVVLVMTTAVEFSMTIWTSDVLHHHDGLSKGTAATGVTAIVAGMAIGRLSCSRLALRYSADALLLTSYAVMLVGFTAFWISTTPVLAFAGLFVSGLGISLHFPLGVTRMVAFSQGRPDVATSVASLGAGLAIGIAPFALGALADNVGSHTAMLVVPAFVLVATVGVLTTRRKPSTRVPRVIGDASAAPA